MLKTESVTVLRYPLLISSNKEFLGDDWVALQEGINHYLGSDIDLLNATNESLLAHSGKQLRPMLSLLIARACGGGKCNEDSIRYAVASELLHNATLMHDDVTDGSDQRRGYPTLRALMGPSISVLVGDFWLVRAVRAILDCGAGHEKAIEMFARTLSDLAEGEMLQLQKASSCDTSFEDYLTIIYLKTGSLFVAAAATAALSVGAGDDISKAVTEYARYLGYAFQVRDDMLDYTGDSQVGKPVGVDVLEQKITLPLLGALENVPEDKRVEIRQKVRHVTPRLRDEIVEFVKAEGGIEYAQKVLETYVDKAVDSLEILPQTREKEILSSVARYIAGRLC